jgi:hypothetical protein
MSEWISSLQAVLRLRGAGLNAPETTLGLWAEAGFLRSRARWGYFSVREETSEYVFSDDFYDDPAMLDRPTHWPSIPSDFWHWVNVKNGDAEAHYEAGIFAAHVVPETEIGLSSDSDHIRLYGVSFHSGNLDALLNGVGELQPRGTLEKPTPSNSGSKPKTDSWADFGGALALFISYANNSQLRSTNGVYLAVADKLKEAGRTPLALKTVKPMIDRALLWIEAGEVAKGSVE